MELRKNLVKRQRKRGWIMDSRRWISILSFVMVLTLLAQPVFALTANVRIEGPNKTIFEGNVNVPESVTIKDQNGENHTFQNKAINALVAASNKGSFPFQTSWSAWGLSLDSIDGISDPNWSKYWNQRINWGNSLLGIGNQPINNKDKLLIHYTGFDPNTFAVEMPLKLEVSNRLPSVGENVTINVSYFDDNTLSFKPLETTVHAGNQLLQSGPDGNITTSFSKDGIYSVFATKNGFVKSNSVEIIAGQSLRIKRTANRSLRYLKSRQSRNGKIENAGTSAWAAMAFGSSSINSDTVKKHLRKSRTLVQYLRSYNPDTATDYARQILAIIASGKNPRNFGRKNLVKGLRLKYKNGQFGNQNFVNDDIFAVLALLGARERIEDSRIKHSLKFIVSTQKTDGGFSDNINSSSNVDMTAAAIQALVYAKRRHSSIDLNDAITKALNYLKNSQNQDGGFPYTPDGQYSSSNVASTSWAIQALAQAREDINKAQSISGITPFGYISSLQKTDGSFGWQSKNDPSSTLMTSYVIMALNEKPLPITWKKKK